MIDYEALQQDALRGIVRAALQQIAETGLPGEHHFYISFQTTAPGVVLSKRLREKYPAEMTIVLQHRFWDLLVSQDRFEVKLTFDGVPERLVVPFASIRVFVDPSVHFGLQFEDGASDKHAPAAPRRSLPADAAFDSVGEARPDSPRATIKKPRAARKPRAEREQPGDSTRQRSEQSERQPPQPEPAAAARTETVSDKEAPAAEGAPSASEGAKVVSLDAFRKK